MPWRMKAGVVLGVVSVIEYVGAHAPADVSACSCTTAVPGLVLTVTPVSVTATLPPGGI
jgi:hypothetical protein